MKIATWNVERLKQYKDIDAIKSEIANINADILVLTETDDRLKPDYPFCFHTALLLNEEKVCYKETEKRVSLPPSSVYLYRCSGKPAMASDKIRTQAYTAVICIAERSVTALPEDEVPIKNEPPPDRFLGLSLDRNMLDINDD